MMKRQSPLPKARSVIKMNRKVLKKSRMTNSGPCRSRWREAGLQSTHQAIRGSKFAAIINVPVRNLHAISLIVNQFDSRPRLPKVIRALNWRSFDRHIALFTRYASVEACCLMTLYKSVHISLPVLQPMLVSPDQVFGSFGMALADRQYYLRNFETVGRSYRISGLGFPVVGGSRNNGELVKIEYISWIE